MLKKKKNNIFSKIIILPIACILIQITSEYKCPFGFIVDNVNLCPTTITCPEGLNRANAYTCTIETKFSPPSKCKTNRECWNGDCVDSEEEVYTKCPSHISCPTDANSIKCPDNTCVNNIDECPDYVECPSFNPIRCGNGDCRKSLSDCPSLVKCPDETFPILCNDGSCRYDKNSCSLASEETSCYDKTMVRCSDGTCTSSRVLCQTLATCPVGYEKCWDGNCKLKGTCFNYENEEEERRKSSMICPNDEILCQFDYSCSKEIDSCPTGIICPIDKPVKCWDNSCRDSRENCPDFQKCPSGLLECPDGSCGLGSCGTHITCSDDAPYRCFDNTCRKNPEDCPSQPSCPSDTPILCWDGRCLAERGECLSPSLCENPNRVKCPNGLCSKSSANCEEQTDCPSEFVKCKDGTCRKKLAYCPKESCPVNLPYKCKNGLCVTKEDFCDRDNGCPFYLPKKCPDGSCISLDKECPDATCESGKLCPDGSCLPLEEICPSINGCPIDTPFKCANGECINLKKTSCSIPICDSSKPIKCFDGTCALTVDYCPVERKIAESGNVICADGTEANSYDECKPLVLCKGDKKVRCSDGSCKNNLNECPIGGSCLNGEVRCPNGSCAKNITLCPNEKGCPQITPYKCPGSGFCVEDLDYCEEKESELPEANGCPQERPYKCPITSNCVSNKEECEDMETDCRSQEVMCYDGTCATSVDNCDGHYGACGSTGTGRNVYCSQEYNFCAKTFGECFNSINCRIDTPFRCSNGECKRYPTNLGSSSGCEAGISCPNYKPYLCADGSCVEKSSFCKSYIGCSGNTSVLCNDKTCAASKDECEKKHVKCPAKNPVLCSNGKCGNGIYDCNESRCPSWTPYYCIMGVCAINPRECQKIEYIAEKKESKINTICKEDEYICIDGTCRENPDECPIYAGCVSNDASFKCLDGGCAENKELCTDGNNATNFDCLNGTTLCQDGICRKDCSFVHFNGCPNEHPLLCPNGRCVSEKIECVGESSCDSTEKPFRCIDGSCASSISNCKIPFREVGNTDILISIYPKIEMNADLIIGPNNILSGKVNIPAGAITNKNDSLSAETQIHFRSVTRSQIDDTTTTYDKTRVDDLKLIYPFADQEGNYTLNYQYTILSSVIEVNLKDSNLAKISGKIILTLLFDFPYKHEILKKTNVNENEDNEYTKTQRYTTLPLNYNKDVCLAKLNINTRKWECNHLNFNVEAQSNLQLKGEINEEGIYAVVMELRKNDNLLFIQYNFLITNMRAITIFLLVLLCLIGIGVYVFLRIYRYRIKYKGTKEIYKGFELELSDLQDKSVTGRQGQTYGDIKEGIIYTDNITFKSQIDSETRKRNTQLEKLFDAYTKKLRLLERNNALLKGQYDSIKNEYNRLVNYKDTLKEGDQVKIEVNIKDPSENQDFGTINDDDE